MDPAVKFDPNPLTVAPDAREFTGKSGKVYHKADSLSARRYGIMEVLNVRLGYGRTPLELFNSHKKAFGLLDKQKFAEAAVEIHTSMAGLGAIADGREHPAVAMTMLFWNAEGEDVATMTDDQLAQKVEDVLHIDVGFFFDQALTNAPGLLSAYREHFRLSSAKEDLPKEEQKESQKQAQPA